jgi:hypothetical protein
MLSGLAVLRQCQKSEMATVGCGDDFRFTSILTKGSVTLCATKPICIIWFHHTGECPRRTYTDFNISSHEPKILVEKKFTENA